MVLRIVGVVLLLLGIAVGAFSILGLATTHAMAELFSVASQTRGVEFDALSWSYHWRSYGAVLFCIGVAVAIAGAIVVQEKAWGLLLFSATAAFSAIVPWAYVQSGLAKYGFEGATLAESSAYGLLAVLATIGFIVGRPNRIGT
jgi:hypothetical protein